jgi:hypothetical protein
MRTVGYWVLGIGAVVIVVSYASTLPVTIGLLIFALGLLLIAVGRGNGSSGRRRSPSGPMQATMRDANPTSHTGTITSDRGWDEPRK